MKNLYQIKKKRPWAGFTGLLLALVMVASCVYLDDVLYDKHTFTAGEEATFTVNMHIEAAEGTNAKLIFSFLVPKAWNAAANTTVTYTDTYYKDVVQTMSLIPAETAPKSKSGMTWAAALKKEFGVGPNLLDEMEWVTYQSDKTYTVSNGDKQKAVITVVTKVGPDRMLVKLGFFVNYSEDGLGDDDKRYNVKYTEDCITVNGEGELIDFCNPHLNLVVPLKATKNDILTIKFQGNARPNNLATDEIYLVAKAETGSGQEYEINEKSAKTRMAHEIGNTYSLTCWAADYFGIPEDEEITRIMYYFSSADGNLKATLQDEDDQAADIWFTKAIICK
jgi:hypothetical protein